MEVLKQWRQQFRDVWQSLNKKQKIIIIGSVLLVLIGMFLLVNWANNPDYVPLFTGLTAQDAGAVDNKLKELGADYQLADGGGTILVPSKDVNELRIQLANEGLPKGKAGFGRFDEAKFGETDTDKKIKYIIALQEELELALEQIDGVEIANVTIVLPEDTLYLDEVKDATASVLLSLTPGTELEAKQVKGIIHLVASGVEGLKPENVTVVNQQGIVLSEGILEDEQKPGGQLNLSQMEFQERFNTKLQKDIQSMLEMVFGKGKVVARVNAALNFDQVEVNEELYTPPLEDTGIVESVEKINEYFKGSGDLPQGVPGTDTNLSGYQATTGNGNSDYGRDEQRINYDVNKINKHSIVAPGAVKRMTVSVIVSDKISNQQQEVIRNLVAGVVGYDEERGDQIVVEGISFDTTYQDQVKQQLAKEESARQWKRWGLIGAVLLILAAAAFIIIRRRRQQEEDEGIDLVADEQITIPQSVTDAVEEKTPEELEKERIFNEVKELAQRKPEDFAQVIRTWMNED